MPVVNEEVVVGKVSGVDMDVAPDVTMLLVRDCKETNVPSVEWFEFY